MWCTQCNTDEDCDHEIAHWHAGSKQRLFFFIGSNNLFGSLLRQRSQECSVLAPQPPPLTLYNFIDPPCGSA